MATSPENTSMAVFCDFENVALGVRDAKYEKFDIKLVLERLLLKGSIVVKKAYCDWDRYKAFKGTMHEANFELIEIPHLRLSGKNSADIRLVVDALDLCYTKSHVNTFVIISGDSDFSPLVSKLRENAKQVIGVGVKQSTSDLLIANCDEFIFYDDLVRETRRNATKRDHKTNNEASNEAPPAQRRTPEEEKRRKEDLEQRRGQAIEIAMETFEALHAERGDGGKIWASVLKQAIKRRKPDFNENYYGFRTFGNLIEEAQSRGLLEFGRDEKSNTYVCRVSGERPAAKTDAPAAAELPVPLAEPSTPAASPPENASGTDTSSTRPQETATDKTATDAPAKKTRGPRQPARQRAKTAKQADPHAPTHSDAPSALTPAAPEPASPEIPAPAVPAPAEVATAETAATTAPSSDAAPRKKPAPRTRRPRKPAASTS
jgi:uncharacterized LabA/DUF88 family protein